MCLCRHLEPAWFWYTLSVSQRDRVFVSRLRRKPDVCQSASRGHCDSMEISCGAAVPASVGPCRCRGYYGALRASRHKASAQMGERSAVVYDRCSAGFLFMEELERVFVRNGCRPRLRQRADLFVRVKRKAFK